MLGAAFDAAEAMHAVGITEDAVRCRVRGEEAEGTRLRAESALHATLGDTDAVLACPDRLVDLAHGADRTPEIAVEDQPAD